MSHEIRTNRSYESPASWYSLEYPFSWAFEEDGFCTSLYDSVDGVGTLQISAYETESTISALDALTGHLIDEGIQSTVETILHIDGQEIVGASYSKEEIFTKIWIITKGKCLLFATYTSDVGVDSGELALVENILYSVQINNKKS